MSRADDLVEFIARVQGVSGLPTHRIQKAIADNGLDISTATPDDIYRIVAGRPLLGPAKEYVPPAKPTPVGELPLAFEERVTRDPGIRSAIAERDPSFTPDGKTAEEILSAYRGDPKPVRQMELPLTAEDEIRALIPFGQRGPGVPIGLSGPGSMQNPGTAMIPAPLRGIPGSGPRRIGTTAGVPGNLSAPGVMQGDPAWNRFVDEWDNTRPFEGNTPLRMRPGLAERGLTTEVDLPRIPGRVIDAPSRSRPAPATRVGAAVGTGIATAAASRLMKNYDSSPALSSTSGTEDLVEESRPAPRVDAAPDYSYEARQLMNQLNAMRRAAGGEVPESKAMMAEINRLLGMSNSRRNAPGFQPAMPTDHHGQAQMLLQKLNAMRMEAGGEVPEAQQIMAEVRRHQAMGDQMRNAG